jgi:hypothetical protein
MTAVETANIAYKKNEVTGNLEFFAVEERNDLHMLRGFIMAKSRTLKILEK